MYIDINQYGDYRLGLTRNEILTYLIERLKFKDNSVSWYVINTALNVFYDIAGINTMAVASDGTILMYRDDVKRFADNLFLNKATYFD